jgi:hypothetical protein
MPELNTRGATRFVFLTRRYAIKVPRFWWYGHFRWSTLLRGLLANMQERAFARTGWPQLCPVYLSLPGGWLLAMPRCEPLAEELTDEQYETFAVLDGRLVAVDYGS